AHRAEGASPPVLVDPPGVHRTGDDAHELVVDQEPLARADLHSEAATSLPSCLDRLQPAVPAHFDRHWPIGFHRDLWLVLDAVARRAQEIDSRLRADRHAAD